jgi:hypothetical protein
MASSSNVVFMHSLASTVNNCWGAGSVLLVSGLLLACLALLAARQPSIQVMGTSNI